MKGLLTFMSDAGYEIKSFATDDERKNVSAYAVFSGTHTGEGGPCPPTGKRTAADYVYVMEFDREMPYRLSVVAIPKTMDNDILWVWQTFGFLSAVERARHVIETLSTEAKSNPRLGVIQLFGSDSGFVVSHAVLASSTSICDAALIPEVDFNMKELAESIEQKIIQRGDRFPYGLIVMAETAIPTDAIDFVDESRIDYIDVGLTDHEKNAILDFEKKRQKGRRIDRFLNLLQLWLELR